MFIPHIPCSRYFITCRMIIEIEYRWKLVYVLLLKNLLSEGIFLYQESVDLSSSLFSTSFPSSVS